MSRIIYHSGVDLVESYRITYRIYNTTARRILDALVKDDGTCTVFEMAKSDFNLDGKPLFPELIPNI